MKRRLTDIFVDALTAGNRPIRILIFGGVFLAWLTLTLLAKIFGVDTNIGGDVDLPNVILIIVSVLIGFGAAYSIVNFLETIKRQRE